MQIIECPMVERGQAKIGELEYGAIVKTTCQPNSVYVKVNKRNTGAGVSVATSRNSSLLLNLKLGTLREVSGDTVVTVYDAELKISRVYDATPFKKI